MKSNNILIIGLGNLGNKYLDAVLKVQQIKFIYLYDKKIKTRFQLKNKFYNNKKIIVINNINNFKKKNLLFV